MTTTHRQLFYAVMAIIGVVVTWMHNIDFIMTHQGFSLLTFVEQAKSNPAGASLANDVGVVGVVFFFWSFIEARRLGMKHWWIYVVLTIVAIACSMPIFLLMRERHLHSKQTSNT